MEKSKEEESPWEKKNRCKEQRKGSTLSSKKQNSFVKATGTNRASRWRSDFER